MVSVLSSELIRAMVQFLAVLMTYNRLPHPLSSRSQYRTRSTRADPEHTILSLIGAAQQNTQQISQIIWGAWCKFKVQDREELPLLTKSIKKDKPKASSNRNHRMTMKDEIELKVVSLFFPLSSGSFLLLLQCPVLSVMTTWWGLFILLYIRCEHGGRLLIWQTDRLKTKRTNRMIRQKWSIG